MELSSNHFKEIIEIKGIIAPIEKDSKIPFRINIKIKNKIQLFFFCLRKKIIYIVDFSLLETLFRYCFKEYFIN